MQTKWKLTILIILIFLVVISLVIVDALKKFQAVDKNVLLLSKSKSDSSSTLSDAALEASNVVSSVKKPIRRWDVLDPNISSEAALIYSLDDNYPFLYYNVYKKWPIASLTKLLSALVILENSDSKKNITMSDQAVATEGEAGDLKSGGIYTIDDLLKIMLLTSSNDAAAAFEEYFGGQEQFAKMLNKKIVDLNMNDSIVYDASGLSDLNESTAYDLLTLVRYILQAKPGILTWTRMQNFLVQPVNSTRSLIIYNIDSFVTDANFLGGKTGTAPLAQENLVGVFSSNNRRIVIILLGSDNRIKEARLLLDWVGKAYEF